MAQIETAISHYGYILNFQRFSDLSLGLLIETGATRLSELYAELQAVMDMEGLEAVPADSSGDCVVFLNVTFTHGRGQLRIEVPNVPG